MSEVATSRLTFGTVAALFQSMDAAQEAVAGLVREGYPRELITILAGQSWDDAPPGMGAIEPDPELRYRLVPASASDTGWVRNEETLPPVLAAFAREALTVQSKKRNRSTWVVLSIALAVVAILITYFVADWFAVTIVALTVSMIVVTVWVMAYARDYIVNFPFQKAIPVVEDALEQGGALVTVRCTLPYQSWVKSTLAQAGGRIIGYAPDVVYPVPA